MKNSWLVLVMAPLMIYGGIRNETPSFKILDEDAVASEDLYEEYASNPFYEIELDDEAVEEKYPSAVADQSDEFEEEDVAPAPVIQKKQSPVRLRKSPKVAKQSQRVLAQVDEMQEEALEQPVIEQSIVEQQIAQEPALKQQKTPALRSQKESPSRAKMAQKRLEQRKQARAKVQQRQSLSVFAEDAQEAVEEKQAPQKAMPVRPSKAKDLRSRYAKMDAEKQEERQIASEQKRLKPRAPIKEEAAEIAQEEFVESAQEEEIVAPKIQKVAPKAKAPRAKIARQPAIKQKAQRAPIAVEEAVASNEEEATSDDMEFQAKPEKRIRNKEVAKAPAQKKAPVAAESKVAQRKPLAKKITPRQVGRKSVAKAENSVKDRRGLERKAKIAKNAEKKTSETLKPQSSKAQKKITLGTKNKQATKVQAAPVPEKNFFRTGKRYQQ